MKRLQILIDEDLDGELERLAAKQGTSKAALPPQAADPLFSMISADDVEPAAVDDVVYR
jgi:hypothetical protein